MYFEKSVFREVLPSLLISLAGLLLMASTLYKNIENSSINELHYLFILNSILCFKNNIELNYADIMSSTVRRLSIYQKTPSTLYIMEYVFDCGTKMFISSAVVSIVIGVCSGYSNIINLLRMVEPCKNLLIFAGAVGSSFFSGVCGSIATFAFVVVCITLSISFNYNPDNVILPIISSSTDYISTISLIYFSKSFYDLLYRVSPGVIDPPHTVESAPMRRVFLTNCILILSIVLVLGIMRATAKARRTPRLFNIWSLVGAFVITMLGGYLINAVSRKNKLLGTMIPLFNGLAGSVALIYTGQITTYTNGNNVIDTMKVNIDSEEEGADSEIENPHSSKTLFTLLAIALFLSGISSLAIGWMFSGTPKMYIAVLGVLLVVEVLLLYHLVNIFVAVLKCFNMSISCHVVPLLNASSDLLGSIVIGAVSLFLASPKK